MAAFRRVGWFVVGFVVVAVWLLLLGSLPSAAAPRVQTNVKLSGDMQPAGDISEVQLSPDGLWAVYTADAETDEAAELYSAPTTGLLPPVRLSGLLAAGSSVRFIIAPDSRRVVYIAAQDAFGVDELYSVPIGGGPSLKLNKPLPTGGDVVDFSVSPDGTRVVYRADQETNDVNGLYSVPVTGDLPVQLNDPQLAGDTVQSAAEVEFGSGRVVYRSGDWVNQTVYPELYSVPIDGGPSVRLNNALPNFAHVGRFLVTPDGERVIYQVQSGLYALTLYIVPIAGGTQAVIVNDPALDGIYIDQTVTPDNQRVVYRVNETPFDTNRFQLYSAAAAGGGVDIIRLNGVVQQYVIQVYGMALSPDGQRVVYLADQQTDNVFELYSVPVGGGPYVKLSGPLTPQGEIAEFRISADSQRVVYRADQQTDEVYELYSAPITGGGAVKLNGVLPNGGDVRSFAISPTGDFVVYPADQQTDDVVELFRVPIAGGQRVKVSGPQVAGGSVSLLPPWIGPLGDRVIYTADQETDEQVELFATFDDSLLTPTPTTTGTVAPTPTATTTPGGDERAFMPAVVRP